MAFSPGTQLTEIINVAILVRNIFDSFFDEFGNAYSQLCDLRDIVLNLHECLLRHAEILEQRQLNYPGHAGFLNTLRECQRFIETYQSVIYRKSGERAKRTAVTAWLATPDAKAEVERLDRLLSRHSNTLIMFNTTLQLTLLSQTGDGPPPIQELEPRHIPPEQERLWEDFRRLQEQQRQEAMTSPPLERHAIGVKTVRDLLAIISKHCEQLGISHEQLPDLAPIHPSSSSFGSTAYSVRSDSSIKALNPAELVSCKATGSHDSDDLNGSKLSDYRYLIEPNPTTKGRTIYWTKDDGSILWRHELRPKTYPFTHHSELGNPCQVSFLEDQETYLSSIVRKSLDLSYMFENKEVCEKFQSFVRNRELLHVVDVGSIKYKNGQLCSLQQLKIWKRSNVDVEPTISFYAEDNDEEEERQHRRPPHAEFVIRWFEKYTDNIKSSTLRLHFYTPHRPPKERFLPPARRKSSDTSKKRYSGSSKFSFFSSSTSPTLVGSGSISPARALYIAEPLEPDDEEKREQNADFEYLDIAFANSHDRDAFVVACQNAHWSQNLVGLTEKGNIYSSPSPSSMSHLPPRLDFTPGTGLNVDFARRNVG